MPALLYELLNGRLFPKKLPVLSATQDQAFVCVIDEGENPPILALPRPDVPYSIDADAWKHQVGFSLLES